MICIPPKHTSDEQSSRPRSRHNAKPWPAQPSSSANSKQSNGQTHWLSNSSSGLVRHSSPAVEPDTMFANMCPHPFKGATLCAINLVVIGGKGQFTRPANHKETTRKQKKNQPDHEPEPQEPITTPTRQFAQNTREISLSPRSTSDTREVGSQS